MWKYAWLEKAYFYKAINVKYYMTCALSLILLLLGAFGYLEKILNLKLSRILRVFLLLIFIMISFGQILLSHYREKDLAQKGKRIATMEQEIQNENKKSATLEAALAENRGRLTDIKKKTEPRSLLPAQRARLAQLLPLSDGSQIAAACRFMDNESCNYAEELIGVFQGLNWHVGTINKTFLDDVPHDAVVVITNDAQVPIAHRIKEALNKVDIKASSAPIREGSISGIRANTIYVIIGSRK